jgi:hypothetical protein
MRPPSYALSRQALRRTDMKPIGKLSFALEVKMNSPVIKNT